MSNHIAHDVDSKERTDDVKIDQTITFSTMLLPNLILDGLSANGFKKPSPIQLAAIPLARCGLDLIVQAKSGTGKTLVFTIAALESIQLTLKRVQAIVLAPTREIAIQITDVMRSVGKNMKGLKVSSLVGGKPLNMDKPLLQGCHIAVGCPARVRHLIDQKLLDSEAVRLLVLDEADRLFDEECDFQKDINFIFNLCCESKQILALSATYPPAMVEFTGRFMRSGQVVTPAGGPTPVLLGLRQFVLLTKDHPDYNARMAYKEKELYNLLSTTPFDLCCIFHHYTSRAESMNNILRKKGFSSTCLVGNQSMDARTEAMSAFRSGKSRVLVTTDLASRGIDSPAINLVINMGLPWNPASYLHRMGRAGRFGTQGVCISLISEGMELDKFQRLLGKIGGTSMGVNIIPKVRKFDIWNDKLDDFDTIFGVLPLDNDEDDAEGREHAVDIEEVNKNNVEKKIEKSDDKEMQAIFSSLSLKELQDNLNRFIESGKKSKEVEFENNEKVGEIYPLSYSQIVKREDLPVVSSPVRNCKRMEPKKEKNGIIERTEGIPSSKSKYRSVLNESNRTKRKRGDLNYSSSSSEFESGSYGLSDSSDEGTMYTIDLVEDDSRSGIDLNEGPDHFESLSDNLSCISSISRNTCHSDASQIGCPHCRHQLNGKYGGDSYTDWYCVLSKQINDYVMYSRNFRSQYT